MEVPFSVAVENEELTNTHEWKQQEMNNDIFFILLQTIDRIVINTCMNLQIMTYTNNNSKNIFIKPTWE